MKAERETAFAESIDFKGSELDMEGIALILIGTAIFSHSWHLLGLYADSRMVGVIMAALAAALVVALFTVQPQFLGGMGENAAVRLGEVAVLQTAALAWGVYAVAVAAHCIWDMEERAVGFFSVLLVASSVIALFFFLQVWSLDNDAFSLIVLVISSAMLAIVGGLLFFTLAVPFPALRSVSGWAMLIQSVVIVAFGLAMTTTSIGA